MCILPQKRAMLGNIIYERVVPCEYACTIIAERVERFREGTKLDISRNRIQGDVTRLLNALARGDRKAEAEVIPLIHRELHQIAWRYMQRERPDHTLQPTALVNEAYLRLVKQNKLAWESRTHFLAIAAQVMRRILLDHARSRATGKRIGNVGKLSLDEALSCSGEACSALLELDEVLGQLASFAPRQAKVVELRFFGGLSAAQAAEALHVTTRTVDRDWQFAKAWLQQTLSRNDATDTVKPATKPI